MLAACRLCACASASFCKTVAPVAPQRVGLLTSRLKWCTAAARGRARIKVVRRGVDASVRERGNKSRRASLIIGSNLLSRFCLTHDRVQLAGSRSRPLASRDSTLSLSTPFAFSRAPTISITLLLGPCTYLHQVFAHFLD